MRIDFTITLGGYGDNPDECWNDAVEGFLTEPGPTPDETEYEETEEEQNDINPPGGGKARER